MARSNTEETRGDYEACHRKQGLRQGASYHGNKYMAELDGGDVKILDSLTIVGCSGEED